MSAARVSLVVVSLLAAGRLAAVAQQRPAAPPDSLRLSALQREALQTDPRGQQLELYATQTELRLRALAAERLPGLALEGQVQHQSDVVENPFQSPVGPRLAPPHDIYEAHVSVQQSIIDPSLGPRRAVERAQLAESQAGVWTLLFTLRQEVNEAFFTAALLQERAGALAAAITDLERRLGEAAMRVREGVALPSDPAAIRAVLLERRQDALGVSAGRSAALARLGVLRGAPIALDAVLTLPDLASEVARARGAPDRLRERPEYAQFARSRERLERQEAVVSAARQPRLSAFGRAGYGRPGLNFLSDDFDTYWLAGVQVQWAPWTWGRTRRDREVIEVQRTIVATDEAAFTEALRRAVQQDLATLDHLEATLAMDDEIVGLRERIERETRLRFEEGVVTAADYVDRSTDVLDARLARAAHRVELAQVRARFLTTLGLEIP